MKHFFQCPTEMPSSIVKCLPSFSLSLSVSLFLKLFSGRQTVLDRGGHGGRGGRSTGAFVVACGGCWFASHWHSSNNKTINYPVERNVILRLWCYETLTRPTFGHRGRQVFFKIFLLNTTQLLCLHKILIGFSRIRKLQVNVTTY